MRISGKVWLSAVIGAALLGPTTAGGAPPVAESLCVAGEEPVLACAVTGGKVMSLCARGDQLQYRFGKAGAVEMTWPEKPGPAKGRFSLSTTMFSGGGEERIRFSSGGFDYVVFQRDIAGDWNPDGTRGHFQDEGVVVLKDGRIVAKKLCVGAVANDAFPKMYDLLGHKEAEPLDLPCCGEK